jgi:hypothetical protein
MHTIDKKILEDRIAELIEWSKNHPREYSTLLATDEIAVLKVVLSNIKELEELNCESVFRGYHRSGKSFVQYLTDNNYLIVKTK